MSEKFSSIDLIILDKDDKVLLVRRLEEPEINKLGLIGGVQKDGENFKDGILRILKEKVGINCSKVDSELGKIYLDSGLEFDYKQVKTYFSDVGNLAGNVTLFSISTNLSGEEFLNLVSRKEIFAFYDRNSLPNLAFEHNKFIGDFFFHEKGYTSKTTQKIGNTVDVVIMTISDGLLKILLSHRLKNPFKGCYSLPGGFVETNLSLDENASNILKKDTGVSDVYLEQLYTFGKVDRDSRGRVLSTAYYALIDSEKVKLSVTDKYDEIKWFSISDLKKIDIAFDHREIIETALSRVYNKIEYTNIAFQLLPEKFTLAELQEVYEVILDREVDKRNFRKKIFELDMLDELDEFKKEGRMRPARYYSFKERNKETPLKAKKWI